MNALANRRARILRLRTIEHRIARMRLARADTALAGLQQIDARLEALGLGIGTVSGVTDGQMLSAMAEMALRLESAGRAMVAPLAEAQGQRAESVALRIRAQQKEMGAQKLHDIAAVSAEAARDLRTNANRPFIKRKSTLEPTQ
jgi:hypothetical protein